MAKWYEVGNRLMINLDKMVVIEKNSEEGNIKFCDSISDRMSSKSITVYYGEILESEWERLESLIATDCGNKKEETE